jgi:hypothetical protein
MEEAEVKDSNRKTKKDKKSKNVKASAREEKKTKK